MLDFIFPPKCSLCGNIDSSSKYPYLCSACFENFKPNREPFCTICSLPFASEYTESHICSACFSNKPHFDQVRSAGIYEGKLEDAIKLFKYKKRRFILKPLSDFMFNLLADDLSRLNLDLVVPVPTSKKKLRERGFNQAYLLAREVGKYLGRIIDCTNLKKEFDTKSQIELDYKERRLNVKGSFSIKNRFIFKDKKILLVDDVFTSGSTLNECAMVLKKEGKAKKVFCLTIARTAPNF